MLSIRLSGTPGEVADAVSTMHDLYDIAEIKGLCSHQPGTPSVRVYLTVRTP